jgi:hypothetical protein
MPLAIYYTSPQPTTYQTQRQPIAGGAWANDTTQPAAGVVTVSALTFNGSTVGVSYATNHGLTLLTTGAYLYRLVPTYADGTTGLPTLPILPGDQVDYECVVSGQLDEQWATETVEARLEAVGAGGTQTYTTTRYTATVAADGSWAVSGLLRGANAVFIFPDKSRVRRVIASASTAAYTSLSAPA